MSDKYTLGGTPPQSRSEKILMNKKAGPAQSRIEELLKNNPGSGLTPEQLEEAIANYLENHPIDAHFTATVSEDSIVEIVNLDTVPAYTGGAY